MDDMTTTEMTFIIMTVTNMTVIYMTVTNMTVNNINSTIIYIIKLNNNNHMKKQNRVISSLARKSILRL